MAMALAVMSSAIGSWVIITNFGWRLWLGVMLVLWANTLTKISITIKGRVENDEQA
jgi:hypothetical protein